MARMRCPLSDWVVALRSTFPTVGSGGGSIKFIIVISNRDLKLNHFLKSLIRSLPLNIYTGRPRPHRRSNCRQSICAATSGKSGCRPTGIYLHCRPPALVPDLVARPSPPREVYDNLRSCLDSRWECHPPQHFRILPPSCQTSLKYSTRSTSASWNCWSGPLV